MDFREYREKFKRRSTTSLIRGYPRFNEDFRRIARTELKRRKVPTGKLPYKKRRVTRRSNLSNLIRF